MKERTKGDALSEADVAILAKAATRILTEFGNAELLTKGDGAIWRAVRELLGGLQA